MLPYTFQLFGVDHIISIILILITYVVLLGFNEKIGIKDNSTAVPVILSFILISLDISEDIVRYVTEHYSIKKDLPFQLCSISIYVAAVALLKKNQTAFELIFYWGMVGASQAILTPDGDLFELKTFFVYSQAYHGILIFTVLWLVIKKGMRMEIKSIPKVVIITNLIVIFISIINYLMDSNYMFLRIRPNSISPFLVGEWPVYIIMVQLFSIVVVTLFIKTQDLLLKPLR